jgi:hypothetical protein
VREAVLVSRLFDKFFQRSDFLSNLPGYLFAELTSPLCCGASACQQMQDQEHETQDKNDVNESGGNVKYEIPK